MNTHGIETIRPDAGDRIPQPPRRFIARIAIPATILAATSGLVAFVGWDAVRPRTDVRATAVAIRSIEAVASTVTPENQVLVQAPGWIEADPYSTYVPALTQGIVSEILVLEGDRVEAGQAVARLVPDDAEIAHRRTEAVVEQRQGVLDAAIAAQRAATVEIEELVEIDRRVAVMAAKEAQLEADLAGYPSRITGLRARIDELKDELARKSKLVEQGAVAAGPVERMRIRLRSIDAEIEGVEAERDAVTAKLAAARAEHAASLRNRELLIHETLELENAKAAVRVAEAELDRAVADRDAAALALERCTVRSAVDGVVIERLTSPGSTIQFGNGQHGAHVIHLYDPAMLQVRADIPLAEAAQVGVGQPAEIVIDLLPDVVFKGRVTRFVHRADVSKNTVEAKVHIDDPSPLLKPDMLARVRILAPGKDETSAARRTVDRVFAPADAIDDSGRIWIVANRRGREGIANRRVVEVGDRMFEGWIEIRSGLRAGDMVILGDGVGEGDAVRIEESNLGADA
ncbi:MAG: efflux RND transporter periplasmic adaptor subunit [Planctomycetota bacterium]|jgi:RND family efflux transporter MFP subunit